MNLLKKISFCLVVLFVTASFTLAYSDRIFEGIVFEQSPVPQPAKTTPADAKATQTQTDKETTLVDMEADVIQKRGPFDSTVYLVGNVKFHHNGAIIECDSAARYDQHRMDFFGRVIINKDSAYVYGDKVSYDGRTAMAEVFAPIVKMLRGDVTLYSYNLRFNTKTNVATYVNGGIMHQTDKFMESERGEYNADSNLVKFKDSVNMRSDSYKIRTDSLDYNLDTETATFLDRTIVWDKDSSILTANRGFYFSSKKTYEFVSDAYILTKDQEMWADTMNYFQSMRQATMLRNVQILDTTQGTIALSDWAYYDDSLGVAILTKTPSLRSFDKEGKDTTYMRADSIFMNTYAPGKGPKAYMDSTAMDEDSLGNTITKDSLGNIVTKDSLGNTTTKDSLGNIVTKDSLGNTITKDSLGNINDRDSLAADSLPPAIAGAVAQSPSKDSLPTADSLPITDSISPAIAEPQPATDKQEKKRHKVAKQPTKVSTPKQENRRHKQLEKAALQSSLNDSLLIKDSLQRSDSLAFKDSLPINDSLLQHDSLTSKDSLSLNDSLRPFDSLSTADSLKVKDTLAKKAPEKERVIRAYYNVRSWAKDYQGVCDSLVAFSVDSMSSMFGRPKMWSENNQITADRIDTYSANEEIDWVDFIGSPFITQKVEPEWPEPADTSRYNQASGREMQAYFKNNELDSAVMSGNVINYYYYMDADGYTSAFTTVTCPELVIFFAKREPSVMRWQGSTVFDIYPLDQIPVDNTQRLEGFQWDPKLRPMSAKEISDRILRDSRRKAIEAVTKPGFTIEKRMEEYKKQMTDNQLWIDRSELTTTTPEYFERQNTML